MPATLSRSDFIRPGATPREDPESDAVVYLYSDARGRPCGQAFAGRAARPAWHYSFPNEETREHEIEMFFARRRATQAAAAARRAERGQPHSLSVGEVMAASWGYEQTNVDFYEVTRVVGAHTVEARPLASARTETGYLSGTCVPVRGRYTGPPRRYRVGAANLLRVSDYTTAHRWDGTPRYWSAYA